jgi:hypothetical protein
MFVGASAVERRGRAFLVARGICACEKPTPAKGCTPNECQGEKAIIGGTEGEVFVPENFRMFRVCVQDTAAASISRQ